MIHHKDLRIGNYIQWVHEDSVSTREVTIKNLRDIYEYNFFPDSEEFARGLNWEPIPLTPEWLEKLGFKKIAGFYELGDYYLIKAEHEDGYNFGYDYDGGVTLATIKYVHQLQNIIFSLSGVELTLS